MEDKNLIESEEDIFQKSLHQEADFYKGMEKHHYKSIWSFFFAAIIALFILFVGLFTISVLIAGAIEAAKQKALSFIPGGFFLFFLYIIIINFIALKLTRRLIYTLKIRNKEFRIKVILLLIIPIALLIFIFILIFPVMFSMGFTF